MQYSFKAMIIEWNGEDINVNTENITFRHPLVGQNITSGAWMANLAPPKAIGITIVDINKKTT